jgi:hypothetical protein
LQITVSLYWPQVPVAIVVVMVQCHSAQQLLFYLRHPQLVIFSKQQVRESENNFTNIGSTCYHVSLYRDLDESLSFQYQQSQTSKKDKKKIMKRKRKEKEKALKLL